MNRKAPLIEGETYHIYNRGAHKLDIFKDQTDYVRFLLLLLLANRNEPLNLRDLFSKYKGRTFAEIFENEKNDHFYVEVLSYALMPNHFHLVLRQKAENGITDYMKRISVAYTMYYNLKHNHSGVLFQGRFKSQHIDSESYFRYIFSYVHLNPLDLFDPSWKMDGLNDIVSARQFLHTYPYSSFMDISGNLRPESSILSAASRPDFMTNQNDFTEYVKWYKEENTKVRPL